MKTICSWCSVVIRDDHSTDRRITHGICKTCEAIKNKELDKMDKMADAVIKLVIKMEEKS